jgi:hypothetical protein
VRRRGKGSIGPRPPGFVARCPECGRNLKANVYGTIPRHKVKFKLCSGSGYQGIRATEEMVDP